MSFAYKFANNGDLMNTDTILRLLKNSGFNAVGTDGVFIHIEDPSCILRSFEAFTDYAWIVITAIAGVLLFGWAISMIRGAKTTDAMFMNLRNLTLIFGALSAAKPIVNFIYGDDIFARGCKTINVSIAEVQKILDARNARLATMNTDDLYEEFDIYDSGAAIVHGGGDSGTTPVSISNSGMKADINISRQEVIYTNPDGTRYRKTGDRSYRNNNPGNLEYGQIARSNGAIGSDGRFAVFPDMESGKNAAVANLQRDRYQRLTLGNALKTWAPPHENDVARYQNHIREKTGFNMNTPMSSLGDVQLRALVDAMYIIEGNRGTTAQV